MDGLRFSFPLFVMVGGYSVLTIGLVYFLWELLYIRSTYAIVKRFWGIRVVFEWFLGSVVELLHLISGELWLKLTSLLLLGIRPQAIARGCSSERTMNWFLHYIASASMSGANYWNRRTTNALSSNKNAEISNYE